LQTGESLGLSRAALIDYVLDFLQAVQPTEAKCFISTDRFILNGFEADSKFSLPQKKQTQKKTHFQSLDLRAELLERLQQTPRPLQH